MKTAVMVAIVLALTGVTVSQVTLDCGGVHVGHSGTLVATEKLSATEVEDIKKASDALAAAQKTYQDVTHKVQRAHGDVQCPSGIYGSSFTCTSGTNVFLDGEFALIYKWEEPPHSYFTY